MVMQGYMAALLPAERKRSSVRSECSSGGPAAGVIGQVAPLGQLLAQSDVIATDMGGTTFKVSVIQNHEIELCARSRWSDRLSLHPAEN